MLLVLLFALSFGLLNVASSGNNVQTGKTTKIDLLKSLIYDNTKATVTLDSSALKQLIQLSSVTIGRGGCTFQGRVRVTTTERYLSSGATSVHTRVRTRVGHHMTGCLHLHVVFNRTNS